ncbi:DUF642 domain-containing protein [Parvularcula sp. ZS-1/3]|uniref:DUF642 domain-containing protein n=1 Tax=Parvularcula mediterranea TaxID=2732508 RepID=A0A7Y3RLC4_9PROT|nr:DUF642 domain-containing protein [Parvularcula mediterranea]NNU15641.1 DUF642 domain-containing protein [Parvularcula mediterranea]
MKSLLLAAASVSAAFGLAHANIVTNGGFEDGNHVNTVAGYDVINPGDTNMTGWTAEAQVAWGKNTTDGIQPSSGQAFVDLTSLSASSPFGTISQTLSTTAGAEYAFSIDNALGDISVEIDGQALSLSGIFGSQGYNARTATFTALGTSTVLRIINRTTGPLALIDNVSVEAMDTAAIPVPAAGLLFLGGAALIRKRRQQA